jgi:methylmalonyl-CoA mutase N-terminal domain/subunit
MVAAIAEGYPQREIADAAYRFQRELDRGERSIVGVNRYADTDEALAIPLLEVPEASLRGQLSRLERVRRERDGEAVTAALAGLRAAARRPGSSESNLMPHFLRCANAYATLGEQCAVLREVFGEYREPVAV